MTQIQRVKKRLIEGHRIQDKISFTRNFDQNICPVRGAYYTNKNVRTYMEKISPEEENL